MGFTFTTKAGTLAQLQGKLSHANIAPLVYFTHSEWLEKGEKCLQPLAKMAESSPNNLYIVRSSAMAEDNMQTSNAGAYLSLLSQSPAQLPGAVNQVFASYGDYNPLNQILIQPMIQGVTLSGVAFSHDPNNGSPYRVITINYGTDTTKVTAGRGGEQWQIMPNIAHNSLPPHLNLVINIIEELLELTGNSPIDIEFAINQAGLWLLQVRPLIIKCPIYNQQALIDHYAVIGQKLKNAMRPHPFLVGQNTIFGVMPDWNPAEIVGIKPKPLALSLYREFITDTIWAYQRHNFGYRNLRSFPLMPHFFGQPYIDVRLSFNSFIPADLPDPLAEKLVNYYIDNLRNTPQLHDKVEFEIVFSCYSFDLPQRLEKLLPLGFTPDELHQLTQSLRGLTQNILHPERGIWRDDIKKLNQLSTRRHELYQQSTDPIEKIYWLIEDGKRYGTLPFAGLARAGFVAVQILKSLVAVGILSDDEYHQFYHSLTTVGSQIGKDFAQMAKGEFMQKYGHLRPGTYNILSQRYDKDPDFYFNWNSKPANIEPNRPFTLSLKKMRQIDDLLQEHGFESRAVQLFEFIKSAIEYREFAKFEFTKNLSECLEYIGQYGALLGFALHDMAFCHINSIKELYIGAQNPKYLLEKSIAEGREIHQTSLQISLPPLINNPDDIWAFQWPANQPNFITHKYITAPICSSGEREKLNGSIVLIPSADPGYDWIFSYKIAGFVTAFGGANSHMAIRAGELDIPAVIGTGEILFQKIENGQLLSLDCANKRIDIL